MIKIGISVVGDEVIDTLNDKECTLKEVAVALLRLKQIEQYLIDKDFKSEMDLEQ